MTECMDCDKPGRPIHPESGPRSPRCATHRRAWLKAGKQRASDKRSRWRSGLDEGTRQEVLAEQGGKCPCGVEPGGKRLNLAADHDHDKAADHDHAEEVACEDCMRGFLCTSCNRDIIGMMRGRFKSDERVRRALLALAAYMADPPAQRVRYRSAVEATHRNIFKQLA